MRKIYVAAMLLSLGPVSVPADPGGDGLKLSDGSGFNSGSTALNYMLTDDQEIDIRQSVSMTDTGRPSNRWQGGTRGSYDFHYYDMTLSSSKLRPFVGANADYTYGSRVNDSILAGPEAGLKVRVQSNTLIVVKAQYQSLYEAGDEIEEVWDDGTPAYGLGIDFRF